ncbi:hypothetical protein MHYP_G00238920 [Metynnis hypsauchen]
MAMMVPLLFVLFSLVSNTVSSDLFKLTGSSVHLDILDTIPEFEELSWIFNRSANVLKYYNETKKAKQYPGYGGRVEFNEETYSLTLKNLQKTDSGLYEAKTSGDVVSAVAEYRLSVLDSVEPPVLTLELNSDTCNIILTCRGHDLSVNSSCYNKTCEEKEVRSPGGVVLSLSVNGSTIICNHSNPVSWKEKVLEMGELKQLCAEARSTETHGLSFHLPAGIVFIIFIVFVTFIAIFFYWRKSRGSMECDTVYAEVENSGAATLPIGLETSTVYSVVGKKPQPPNNGQSNQTPVPEVEMTRKKPETIYATVSQPSNVVSQAELDEATPEVRN